MTLIIITILLITHINGHIDNNIDYRWNPLQFPNTKIYAILTFDNVDWNKLFNQTNITNNENDNDNIYYICNIIKQCFHDALGYTLHSIYSSNTITTTQSSQTTPTINPTQYRSRYTGDHSSSSSSGRRLLHHSDSHSDSDSDSQDEYDSLLHKKISFKNIKKSLLPHNRFNYTFGVLFNDLDIYNQYTLISIDTQQQSYQLFHAVFSQCLYLSLNTKHVHLHVLSLSQGMYTHENIKSHNNTNDTLIVDLEGTQTPISMNGIQYKVMITLNEMCLSSKGGQYVKDIIINEIITFYADCLCWKNDDELDKYKTYQVSEIDMVYFFKIIDNDRACLIDIDMEYLQDKCVDMIEYEPIYELDIQTTSTSAYSIQCESLDVSTSGSDLWNLDFFDGLPNNGIYSILENHDDHGIDLYILDTGILTTHDIFLHNENKNLVYIHRINTNPNDIPLPTQAYTPTHYHGTYVAGIAGGNVYGISRNLTIYDYAVCEGSSCSYSKVLAGIEAAKKNMLTTGRRGVINLSFGGPILPNNDVAREKWDFIMKGIIDAGGIPVCSAGNTQLDGCDYVPGQSKYCISVGAFDEYGNLYSRTNYGTCVNIFAPGVSIRSAGTATTSEYVTRSGTSAAAPHITGLISNLLWINPHLTFEHILYIINENKQFLLSCPNYYTQQTQCPYIALPCDQFETAINEALIHVHVASDITTMEPTYPPTNVPVVIRDTSDGGDGDAGNILSGSPTISPTINPSSKPTNTPTKSPTISPSDIPSTTPTQLPTEMPTSAPSYKPTKNPSKTPSASPSKTPTSLPTNSHIPTVLPTISITPTMSPSNAPTNVPTDMPTARYQGLGLGGFNNGFTVDINPDSDNSSRFIQDRDKHDDTCCSLQISFEMLLVLCFSLVLSFYI